MIVASEEEEENGGKNEHEEIYYLEAFGSDGAKNGDGQTHDYTDIKDVTANNVAYDKIGFFVAGGDDGGDELW